jgi:uncharacterized protein
MEYTFFPEQDNPLAKSVLLISKLRDEQVNSFKLTPENTPWLESVLDNIKKEFEPEQTPEGVESIEVNLTLKRDSNAEVGEYLYVEGVAKGGYQATCVRCLIDTPQSFEKEFKGAYINKRYEDDPEYEDIDEIFVNNETADLFFHDRGKADLVDVVTEACFLGTNRYPLHHEDCKGLCHTCGTDLNTGTCKH